MAIKTLSIKGTDSRDVARQAREALAEFQPKLLLFFASSTYESPEAALKEPFPAPKSSAPPLTASIATTAIPAAP